MERIKKWYGFFTKVGGPKIPAYAAHTGYFVVLSVFPLLLLLLSLLRYTGLGAEYLVAFLEGLLPSALLEPARQLILGAYWGSSPSILSVSALAALWSASRGVHGIMAGLNGVYNARESRGYFHTRWLSVVYTFVFLLLILVSLGLNVLGNAFFRGLMPMESFLGKVVDVRFFVILILQTLVFTAMFTALPARPLRLRDGLPGALFASAGWLIFSDLYSIYVKYFSPMQDVFGSVYAVALSMLWLYCCICIVFYGGVINRLLIDKPRFTEE